jgi:hypothetical protein
MRRTFSGDNILQLYLVVPSNGKLEIPTPTVGIWGDRRPRSPPFLYSVDDTRGSPPNKKTNVPRYGDMYNVRTRLCDQHSTSLGIH